MIGAILDHFKLTADGGAEVGTDLSPPLSFYSLFYAPTPDGRRFLVVQGVGQGSSDLVLLENGLAGVSE